MTATVVPVLMTRLGRVAKHGRGAAVKSNAAWAILDASHSVWTNRQRLRDAAARRDAAGDVAWDTGEAVTRTAAGIAATVLAASAVTAGGATAAVAAPLIAGAAGAYCAGKAVNAARNRTRKSTR